MCRGSLLLPGAENFPSMSSLSRQSDQSSIIILREASSQVPPSWGRDRWEDLEWGPQTFVSKQLCQVSHLLPTPTLLQCNLSWGSSRHKLNHNLWVRRDPVSYSQMLHFTVRKTMAQIGELTCPRSDSWTGIRNLGPCFPGQWFFPACISADFCLWHIMETTRAVVESGFFGAPQDAAGFNLDLALCRVHSLVCRHFLISFYGRLCAGCKRWKKSQFLLSRTSAHNSLWLVLLMCWFVHLFIHPTNIEYACCIRHCSRCWEYGINKGSTFTEILI